jgi:hypothetical protein
MVLVGRAHREGNRMRARKGDKRHDLAAGEVVQRRKPCRDEASRSLFSPSRQATLLHTNFGDFFSSAWPQALNLTGRRDSKLPRGHLGLHRTTCQACRVIGMKFVAVRICEASCHCVSDPYIERASSTGIWLQWPHWDVMLLTLPSSAKRGAQMLQLDSLSKQHIRCCGNFTASHWLCMLTCYLMVCPSLLRRISASNAHYATALVTMQ